jgi:hypothetical protein
MQSKNILSQQESKLPCLISHGGIYHVMCLPVGDQLNRLETHTSAVTQSALEQAVVLRTLA